jgi:ATP-dependent DNA helicase RecQ
LAEGELEPGGRFSWGEVRHVAEQRFGFKQFRPGQRELITLALSGRDALGVLPTGAGKSLCYQLPSLFLKGAVVVVSPLIALMQDQHEHLQQADIEAARLDSTVTQRALREQEVELCEGAHDLVLVTPERLQSPEHQRPLQDRGVALFVVDEAHCVSQWGHDFRPAYGELRHVIEALGRPPIMALTATAPPSVADSIIQSLGMRNAVVVQGGIERPNLKLEVARTVNEEEKKRQLLALLEDTPGAGIVYASTVRQVGELHRWLESEGISVAHYHGKLRATARTLEQERFMSGNARLMVATQAFGMGIDKPDIRFVVHWNFPDSIESYYQEAGRAGRDGETARVVLFYRLEDKRIRSFFLGHKHPRRDEALALLVAMETLQQQRRSCTMQGLAEAASLPLRRTSVIAAVLETMDLLTRSGRNVKLRRALSQRQLDAFVATFEGRYIADRERMESMMRYGQTTRCRMQFLREYFSEQEGAPCKHCDNCEHPPTLQAASA